ncbi:hypothetical protein E4U42_001266 [Claviceps africana]|uniref:Uncharacterized protein n=1 Tax=Claviceps africana TaxID=83212 RepID=A0A8K0NI43_9HYPO|nr:hypothetical protein E4U42_001266 [Claviceps africana]
MAPRSEKSHLKRSLGSPPEDTAETKKTRRSERLSAHVGPVDKTPIVKAQQLPSPLTNTTNGGFDDASKNADAAPTTTPTTPATPARNHDGLTPPATDEAFGQSPTLSSPPHDTQPHSQYVDRHPELSDEVEDEVKEGVWGYLTPLDPKYGDGPIALKKRSSCPKPDSVAAAVNGENQGPNKKPSPLEAAEAYDRIKTSSGGYSIGRYPECDIVVKNLNVSNRHCLLFAENKDEDVVAVVADFSSNGTFVNDAIIGCNNRRELEDQDEIAVHGQVRFIFRYPLSRRTSLFTEQYTLLQKLGSGHFADVHLCLENSTGQRYAVKVFSNLEVDARSKTEGLEQEISVLTGITHPNILCLRDTFHERHRGRGRVYIVLELAAEGELFNYIVMKQKLSEYETRKVFLQLFQGVKYLHDRNIVHRDIKPENILLTDKNLTVKLADFGLSKIVGESKFTTTLCGTPSYVAPEILADSRNREYTKAVDIWSLGVVLYICLCGFPPFSDELYSEEHFPFFLKDQIRSGRFDYPSPFWDSVGDLALDLIDSMLVVNPARRFTIENCLAHPWLTENMPDVNDSTNGLVGAVAGLKVDRRGPPRERTLYAHCYSVQVDSHVDIGVDKEPVKVFSKKEQRTIKARKEEAPDHKRAPEEFMRLGGKGDQRLFSDDHDGVLTTGEELGKRVKKTKARAR